MDILVSNNIIMIRLTLWLILGLNAVFIWTEFYPLVFEDIAINILSGLNSIRMPLTIVEFLAIATLFVDLVVRFDNISKRWIVLQVIAVGICVCGFLFKVFTYYLDSAYLT
jgi:hypothetical protein|tara:strand:- start:1586 stop:1918 length:333 start_codon:yes stop_codon:yes gene_type:complete